MQLRRRLLEARRKRPSLFQKKRQYPARARQRFRNRSSKPRKRARRRETLLKGPRAQKMSPFPNRKSHHPRIAERLALLRRIRHRRGKIRIIFGGARNGS